MKMYESTDTPKESYG